MCSMLYTTDTNLKAEKVFWAIFCFEQILIMLGKIEYAKYIPPLKTHSKQNELERVWNQITLN